MPRRLYSSLREIPAIGTSRKATMKRPALNSLLQRSRWAAIAATVLLLATVGLVDYVTPPTMAFSLFYLFSIFVATWYLGIVWGVVTCVVAAIIWFLAGISEGNFFSATNVWNTGVRLGIFLVMAVLLYRLKRRIGLERLTRQLRAMAVHSTEIEERERRRIARIIHEDFQQSLVASILRLGELKQLTKDGPLQQAVSEVDKQLHAAVKVSRSLTSELSPQVLYRLGLGEALVPLVKDFEEKFGLRVKLDIDPHARLADEVLSIVLYRAARELLLNVVKHAGVKAATVQLERYEDNVVLIVSDEGRGFEETGANDTKLGSGFGLFGLRERIEQFGGHVEIDSAAGLGTQVTIAVPLSVAENSPPGPTPIP